jgi:hypothetical protein
LASFSCADLAADLFLVGERMRALVVSAELSAAVSM